MADDTASRKAKITDVHRSEAAKLKAIWDKVKPPNQKEFGMEYGIGGQTMVANYLNAHSPLNLTAAAGFARGLGCKIWEFSRRLSKEAEKIAEAAGLLADENFVPIQRLSVAAGAGPGRVNGVVEVEGELQFRSDFLQSISLTTQQAKIISVRGGSMEPTIQNGAVILINQADTTVREGHIYAFVKGEEMLVKRFLKRNGDWVAASDNGDPDIHFDEAHPPLIQGRAVWMGAKL
ncbi:S24 family peptidase [Variovorax atrisoli]|uniref:S24 family peptidase n=1 Tax=Variovorax atrisoli TaxID=3394203 RepID=UPI00036F8AAA|nr:S24 family peptidase [Variovorax paradoxus]